MRDKGTIWALIPVKEFGSAKSRLRTVLNGDECAGLALNMVRDVAAAITGSEVVNGLSLLGSGPEIEKLADELHCECMEEFYDVDLSCNLGLAARQLDTNGVTTLIIIPGDLPTLRVEDVDQLITRTECDLGVSAAGRDGGTNALVLTPPGALAFQFGKQSARRHLEAGEAAGLSTVNIDHPAFSVDIDTPDDLAWLCKQAMTGHTADFLDQTGIRNKMLDSEAAVPA